MDSFHVQNIKVEKANKTLKHRRLKKLTTLFRVMEVCVFLIIISRSSTILLPVAFKFSGEYIKGIFVSLLSPLSVFVIGNVIVIILFLKSGRSSSSPPPQEAEAEATTNNSKIDLYDEYVKSCQTNQIVRIEENKQSVCLARREISYNNKGNNERFCFKQRRIHRSQSQSENLKNMHSEEYSCGKMRRSATERCLESAQQMSNEDFKCRVEAFIARRQRLLREEEEFTEACVSVQT